MKILQKLNQLTQFKGTMGRSEYWLYLFASIVISASGIIAMILLSTVLHPQPEFTAGTLVMIIVKGAFTIAFLMAYFCAITRRLHDLNLTGYCALLFILAGLFWPLLLAMIIILGAMPSRPTNNRFIKAS